MEEPWVRTMCVVTFHQDQGQKVQLQYPQYLNDQEQKALAFLAFPDSNSFNTLGDLSYVFKMRSRNGHLYGYTYFRQQRDPSEPRGYFQKSVVVVSSMPYIGLFRQIALIIGPLYFQHGPNLFEVAESCVKTWGPASPGNTLELPMLGDVINYTVPASKNSTNHQPWGEGLTQILDSVNQGFPGMFQDLNIFEILGKNLVKNCLWTMWELAITGESILILSDTPGVCSTIVLALVSLISPLPYRGEFFPYFTIFDQQFKNLADQNIGPFIIGATNPFFQKSVGGSVNIFQFEQRNNELVCVSSSIKGNINIQPVRNVISQLLTADTKQTQAINNSILKRHFRDLTYCVLQPFQQYLSVNLIQLRTNPYQFQTQKTFSNQQFIKEINSSRTVFPLLRYLPRPKAINFYQKFIRTSTFGRWFAQQRQRTSKITHDAMQEAIHDFDIQSLIPKLNSNQLRNLYQKMQSQLKYEQALDASGEIVQNLKCQLSRVLSALTGSREEDLFKVFSASYQMEPLKIESLQKQAEELLQKFSMDSFDLLSTIGTGAFSRVKLVKSKDFPWEKPMVLKILSKFTLLKKKQVGNLKREKNLLAVLRHPSVPRLLGTFQDERCVYLVMEFICGGELHTRLKRTGCLQVHQTRFYTVDIANILQFLHLHGVVYRDLKPENILFDRNGYLKLVDFGFAKLNEEKSYTMCGTPEYLAPQVILNKGYGQEVDWWALGVILYQMLSGYPPYFDSSPQNIYQKIVMGRLVQPPSIDDQAFQLIARLLEPDTEKRLCMAQGKSIKDEVWLEEISFQEVARKEVQAPWVPEVTHQEDTQYFQSYPEDLEEVPLPFLGSRDPFEGF